MTFPKGNRSMPEWKMTKYKDLVASPEYLAIKPKGEAMKSKYLSLIPKYFMTMLKWK